MTTQLVLPPDRTRPLPETREETASVRFRVSDDMVARFASLTCDRSSLHVDVGMARRSAYRQPIVHGMLPVGFLALSPHFRVDGFYCSPIAITGRFVAPVYAGDKLVLTTRVAHGGTSEKHFAFEYRIENEMSGGMVVSGDVTVEYRQLPVEDRDSQPMGDHGMLAHPLALNNVLLEHIEVGTRDSFDFRISREAVAAFVAILSCGIETPAIAAARRLHETMHLPNFLAVLLFSTSVGVSLPGASATFLEFSAQSASDIVLGRTYSLAGEVAHKSTGTRIVKKKVVVRDTERPADVPISGKVATLVNKPSRRMPSVEDLRTSALDWGLEDKVVLITGASRGIGETTAKLFALFGARVIVNYHRGAADARRVVEEIERGGGKAFAVGADVTRESDVDGLVQLGMQRFGPINILVNNAVRDYRPIPFNQLTWDDVQRDIDVIAKGAFLCCQRVIRSMLNAGGGKIINIASVATDTPPPDQTKYVMAKSALVGLTRSLAVEYAARNIQVNMVVPSFVETDLVAHVQEGFRTRLAEQTPMGRLALPADVAQAVVFLASSFSSFTTGQKILVTGGGAPYL